MTGIQGSFDLYGDTDILQMFRVAKFAFHILRVGINKP